MRPKRPALTVLLLVSLAACAPTASNAESEPSTQEPSKQAAAASEAGDDVPPRPVEPNPLDSTSVFALKSAWQAAASADQATFCEEIRSVGAEAFAEVFVSRAYNVDEQTAAVWFWDACFG